jgi:hypothetical protein
MARKSNRPRRTALITPDAAASVPVKSKEEQLAEEYAYVIRDLRRVAVLAVIMFALLIALNLLLQ